MKIKETVGYAEKSDMEFYADLSAAVEQLTGYRRNTIREVKNG